MSTQKVAFGSWTVPTENPDRFHWFFAVGSNDVHVGEREFTFAGVGRGTCVTQRSRNAMSFSCRGRAGALTDDPSGFKMDVLASQAKVRVRDGAKTHTATWKTGDLVDDGLYTSQTICEDEAIGAGGGLARESVARAHMFNHHLKQKRARDFALMLSGGTVETCGLGAEFMSDLAAGKHVELTFKR